MGECCGFNPGGWLAEPDFSGAWLLPFARLCVSLCLALNSGLGLKLTPGQDQRTFLLRIQVNT